MLWDIPMPILTLKKVDIYFESEAGKIKIVEMVLAANYSEEKATEILSKIQLQPLWIYNEK